MKLRKVKKLLQKEVQPLGPSVHSPRLSRYRALHLSSFPVFSNPLPRGHSAETDLFLCYLSHALRILGFWHPGLGLSQEAEIVLEGRAPGQAASTTPPQISRIAT